ncbi:methyltransferase domain-containing protein [Glaciecola sp. MH2013]|uniref:tRNA (guanine(46)-N(7))-methyltransferase TrmB n=1 Tax=Glaciecola sp. MH2013 TaxID=2785524 RepID=UPI00189D4481|nr:methyltransferase domain-containing protein [Glaciecola sp. MH2013]MBF7071795.1 methyltransferase domain-containing protein [Glaciecola sp. MH2013]
MKASPREITTNQQDVHDDLTTIVRKYRDSDFKKPVAEHTQQAFDATLSWLNATGLGHAENTALFSGDVIIDACCGVGESSLALAQQFPNAKVIGIDKSGARLAKHTHYLQRQNSQKKPIDNLMIIQADLNDFWRLMAQHQASHSQWRIAKQCLFYPNPYPKKSQVQKRWHASPAFPFILACSKHIELRSNWRLYLEEFQLALLEYGVESDIHQVSGSPITPFERKYSESGQLCWQLQTRPSGDDK